MDQQSNNGEIERVSMGIPGLDDVLGGGLPANRLYLFQGDPGAGKTTVAMQFLLEGVKSGQHSLYITLSETKEELQQVADSHGWDISAINHFELSAVESRLRGEAESTFFHPSDVELNHTVQILLEEIEAVKPDRVVFDSLSEMRMLAETPLRYRRQILQLKQFFSGKKITVLFLDDRTSENGNLQIESIAHGVVNLFSTVPDYGVARRQLRVQKLRGSKFREGNHDFVLQKGGMALFPRLVAADHFQEFEPSTLASGIPNLDALLGGGLDRGTSTIIVGPSGTGKSSLAACFADQAAKLGQKSVLFAFDETVPTLLARCKSLKMDLSEHIEKGLIKVRQIDPAEIAPGELAHFIRESVAKDNTRMVILDSINGYTNAMPGENFLNLQLHELLVYLSQQGVITMMLLAQQGIVGNMQSSVELTYLADTVVLMRYFESRGTVLKAISVIKKRSGNHERTIREISTTADGITVGKPLSNMHGVLSGVPTFLGGETSAEP